MGSSAAAFLLFSLAVFPSIILSAGTELKGIDLENPVVNVTLSPLAGYASSSPGSKDVTLCKRIRVIGQSRFKLGSYASAYQVTMVPSAAIPERLHSRIQICFHRNVSRDLCQCEKDEWKALHKGLWRSVISPYEDRFLDVKFVGESTISTNVSVEEEFQRWRLFCLAFGFLLLLVAPVVSSWVPFYYSSSMAIGVFLVVIILLFQGMKLLPTGRKNVLYLTIYGSVLGAGSFLLHQFSVLVNSILVSFGLSEEMHNPVAVFLLVGIVLAGAALGYWIVRKYVISEDGSVDLGVAQFVKWAMRILATTFIIQSSIDTPLAVGALASCLAISFLITSFNWTDPDMFVTIGNPVNYGNVSPWKSGRRMGARQNRAEFLSRPGKVGPKGTLWNSPNRSSAWTNSPSKGLVSPSTGKVTKSQENYYSSFHKTPNRKKFSKREWEKFTEESTRQSVAALASSPEFTDWLIKHQDRIQVLPDDSSDETFESGSDSTDDNVVENGERGGWFGY
ncbi:hypothetical protein NMG60_11001650 [Bertholletia excelsa]